MLKQEMRNNYKLNGMALLVFSFFFKEKKGNFPTLPCLPFFPLKTRGTRREEKKSVPRTPWFGIIVMQEWKESGRKKKRQKNKRYAAKKLEIEMKMAGCSVRWQRSNEKNPDIEGIGPETAPFPSPPHLVSSKAAPTGEKKPIAPGSEGFHSHSSDRRALLRSVANFLLLIILLLHSLSSSCNSYPLRLFPVAFLFLGPSPVFFPLLTTPRTGLRRCR